MLVVDIETRSLAPIKTVGAWAYSRHKSTEPLCMCGTDPATLESITVDFTSEVTDDQRAFFNDHEVKIAHNYAFEEAIFYNQLWNLGFLPPKGWLDTMDICAYMGVPLSLAQACEFLFQDDEAIRKDAEGTKLKHKICVPREGKFKSYTQEDYEGLMDYCMTDVEVTSQIFSEGKKYIPSEEWVVMKETHEMNFRGIPLRRDLIQTLFREYEESKQEIDLSKYGIENKDLKRNKYLQDKIKELFDVEMPNMQAATVEGLIADGNTPEGLKEILECKQVFSASSLAKLTKAWVLSDMQDVVRNSFQYHGAKTGRFAGRGVQPQNMPRGFKKDEDIYKALKELGL